MKKEFIDQLIAIELDRAKRLHPGWPNDIIHAAAIVVEEAGELMKACLDFVYFDGDEKSIQNEIVSVAAMAERFMLYFPIYFSTGLDPFAGSLLPKFKRREGKDE